MPDQRIDARNIAARLEAEVIRQKETIEALRTNGHIFADAQRQLERLEADLALLKK